VGGKVGGLQNRIDERHLHRLFVSENCRLAARTNAQACKPNQKKPFNAQNQFPGSRAPMLPAFSSSASEQSKNKSGKPAAARLADLPRSLFSSFKEVKSQKR
jgi:hypothetical protein